MAPVLHLAGRSQRPKSGAQSVSELAVEVEAALNWPEE